MKTYLGIALISVSFILSTSTSAMAVQQKAKSTDTIIKDTIIKDKVKPQPGPTVFPLETCYSCRANRCTELKGSARACANHFRDKGSCEIACKRQPFFSGCNPPVIFAIAQTEGYEESFAVCVDPTTGIVSQLSGPFKFPEPTDPNYQNDHRYYNSAAVDMKNYLYEVLLGSDGRATELLTVDIRTGVSQRVALAYPQDLTVEQRGLFYVETTGDVLTILVTKDPLDPYRLLLEKLAPDGTMSGIVPIVASMPGQRFPRGCNLQAAVDEANRRFFVIDGFSGWQWDVSNTIPNNYVASIDIDSGNILTYDQLIWPSHYNSGKTWPLLCACEGLNFDNASGNLFAVAAVRDPFRAGAMLGYALMDIDQVSGVVSVTIGPSHGHGTRRDAGTLRTVLDEFNRRLYLVNSDANRSELISFNIDTGQATSTRMTYPPNTKYYITGGLNFIPFGASPSEQR